MERVWRRDDRMPRLPRPALEIGDTPPGLLDDRHERGDVMRLEPVVELDHRVHGPARHEHVAEDVAEAPYPPGRRLDRPLEAEQPVALGVAVAGRDDERPLERR